MYLYDSQEAESEIFVPGVDWACSYDQHLRAGLGTMGLFCGCKASANPTESSRMGLVFQNYFSLG